MRQYSHATDLKDTLKSIEINLANNCNRACVFCPHSLDTYEFKQGLMSIESVEIIAKRLIEYGYKNRVSVCGFGEPLVNKNIQKVLKILSKTEGFLELTTNGDLLDEDNIPQFFDNGLDLLNVSIYDTEADIRISELLPRLLPDNKFVIRRRYLDYSNLVNRVDIIKNVGDIKNKPCYVPSYKMMIDYDGNVLLCSNDWSREKTYGNILTTDLEILWFENMKDKRIRLLNGDRSTDACKTCDIEGTKVGKEIANLFKMSYGIDYV